MTKNKTIEVLESIKEQFVDCVRIANSPDAKDFQKEGKIVMMLKRSKKFGKQLDGLIETGYSKMINYSDGAVKELSK